MTASGIEPMPVTEMTGAYATAHALIQEIQVTELTDMALDWRVSPHSVPANLMANHAGDSLMREFHWLIGVARREWYTPMLDAAKDLNLLAMHPRDWAKLATLIREAYWAWAAGLSPSAHVRRLAAIEWNAC